MAKGRRLSTHVVAEDIAAAGVHHALVQVHGAALRARDRLGHKDRVHAMLDSNLFGRVLEQECLVRHLHWVAVHQVDLVLGHAHFVNPGVGVDAQSDQRIAELVPERRQLVEHVQAKGRLADFAFAIARHGRRERQGGVVVRRGQIKLEFRRDHRRQALGGVTRDHLLQQAARRKRAGLAVHLNAIVDGEGARRAAPRRKLERAVVRRKAHVRVRVRKNRIVGIVTGDALHRDGLRNAQLRATGKAAGGHQFAAWVARDVGKDAFDLADAM